MYQHLEFTWTPDVVTHILHGLVEGRGNSARRTFEILLHRLTTNPEHRNLTPYIRL